MTFLNNLFLISFFIFSTYSSLAHADQKLLKTHAPVKLERVIDGDTIVASGRKIRLWGIDAPEADEDAGAVATMLLKSYLNTGEELRCKFIEKDRYKRDVMHCLSDDRDVGSMMVQLGYAKDFTKYSGGYYQFEEDKAKESGRGIWKKYD